MTAEPPRPDPMSASGVDRFGVIETRGIDYIPVSERHGHPREMFVIFAISNINYSSIVIGGLLPLSGLSLWQSLAAVILGNLAWAFVGILASSGPRAGTPAAMVMRSMFGVRGNQINVALTFWALCMAYEAIWLIFAIQTGLAFLALFGLTATVSLKLLMLCAIAAATLAISVYGHATIVRLSGICTLLLALGLIPLMAFVAPHIDLAAAAAAQPAGSVVAAVTTGLVLVASGAMSWNNGADYARYLPTCASPGAVAAWTAFGGFVPSVILQSFGVLAASAVDMSNFQEAIGTILPGWFYPIFLLLFLMGTTSTNALVAYASGLSLQALGVKIRRSLSVLVDGAVAMAVTCYALFISDFTSTMTSILELAVILLGPCIAIYATDMALRRNRYDGVALNDDSPASPVWYASGFNWAGLSAQFLGTLASLACINTPVFVGPLSKAMDGTDLSIPAGMLIAAAIYGLAFQRHSHPASASEAARPIETSAP